LSSQAGKSWAGRTLKEIVSLLEAKRKVIIGPISQGAEMLAHSMQLSIQAKVDSLRQNPGMLLQEHIRLQMERIDRQT
jgi:hypothetical protein